MRTSFKRYGAPALLAVITGTACGTISHAPAASSTEPARQAEPSRMPRPEERRDSAASRHSDPDVRFIQGMMAHHAQALVMTDLVTTRSSRRDVRLLAERIKVSQEDEIAIMRRWLEERGETVPSLEPHHQHPETGGNQGLMPGMLSQQELTRLAAASGTEFDRLFLQFMIRHHEGALTMVAELFATPGAAQNAAIFRLASEVDADQRAEIERMRVMLSTFPSPQRGST